MWFTLFELMRRVYSVIDNIFVNSGLLSYDRTFFFMFELLSALVLHLPYLSSYESVFVKIL